MRVTWVHPSWRDLVIEELVRDAAARRRFLAHCGVDGAALALSVAGGAAGERQQPLLASDADWDALGDGLYKLCAELDDAGATQLLTVLGDAPSGPELDALSVLVLDRLRKLWTGRPVSVEALSAWAELATWPAHLPAVAQTWVELEPLDAPASPAQLERFADWLRLAELLAQHDPALLTQLGFPARQGDAIGAFVAQLGDGEPPQERALRVEALRRLSVLDADRYGRAMVTVTALTPGEDWEIPDDLPLMGSFSVDRVLRDLE